VVYEGGGKKAIFSQVVEMRELEFKNGRERLGASEGVRVLE
jgi:hypothetical protein